MSSFLESNRAFILCENGEINGVVCFKDIAKALINAEAQQRMQFRMQVDKQDGDYLILEDL